MIVDLIEALAEQGELELELAKTLKNDILAVLDQSVTTGGGYLARALTEHVPVLTDHKFGRIKGERPSFWSNFVF